MMAMMLITTRSSMRVKPRRAWVWVVFICVLLCGSNAVLLPNHTKAHVCYGIVIRLFRVRDIQPGQMNRLTKTPAALRPSMPRILQGTQYDSPAKFRECGKRRLWIFAKHLAPLGSPASQETQE